MQEAPKKICKRCEEEKTLDNFYAHPTSFDKLGIYCKSCQSKISNHIPITKKSEYFQFEETATI